jgi:hypothetical protein
LLLLLLVPAVVVAAAQLAFGLLTLHTNK